AGVSARRSSPARCCGTSRGSRRWPRSPGRTPGAPEPVDPRPHGARPPGRAPFLSPEHEAVPGVTASSTHDVIVVGVGAHGSATVHELAARGARVLGLERWDVPTTMGSSGGVNRIIRLAYNEDPRYVPLLRRAYERWRALETRWGQRLL